MMTKEVAPDGSITLNINSEDDPAMVAMVALSDVIRGLAWAQDMAP